MLLVEAPTPTTPIVRFKITQFYDSPVLFYELNSYITIARKVTIVLALHGGYWYHIGRTIGYKHLYSIIEHNVLHVTYNYIYNIY